MNSLKKNLYGISLLILASPLFLGTSAYSKAECYTSAPPTKTPDGKLKYTFQVYDPDDTDSHDHLKTLPAKTVDSSVPIDTVKAEALSAYNLEHLERCISVPGKGLIPPSQLKSD